MTTAISFQSESSRESAQPKREKKDGAFQATLQQQSLGTLALTLDPTATASLPGAGTALVQADSVPRDAARAAEQELSAAEREQGSRDRGQDVASRSSRELAEQSARSNPLGEAGERNPGTGRLEEPGSRTSDPRSGAAGASRETGNAQAEASAKGEANNGQEPTDQRESNGREAVKPASGVAKAANPQSASAVSITPPGGNGAGGRAASQAGSAAAGRGGVGGVGRVGTAGKVSSPIGPGLDAQRRANQTSRAKGVIRHEQRTFEAQLQRGLAQVLRQRGGTLKLKLDPNDLGTVKISLKLSQGRVAGSIEATNERAHDLLRQHVEVLKNSLERRGITVDRLDVRHAGAAESGRQNVGGSETQRGLDQQSAESGDDRHTGSGRGEDRPHDARGGIPGESEEAGVRGTDSATDDALSHGREGGPLAGWLRLDTVV